MFPFLTHCLSDWSFDLLSVFSSWIWTAGSYLFVHAVDSPVKLCVRRKFQRYSSALWAAFGSWFIQSTVSYNKQGLCSWHGSIKKKKKHLMSPCPDSANQLSICILGQWISRDSLWALCACYIFLQDSWKFSTLCLELECLNYEYTANTAVRAKLNASHCLFSLTQCCWPCMIPSQPLNSQPPSLSCP